MNIRYLSPTSAGIEHTYRLLQNPQQVQNVFACCHGKIIPLMKMVHTRTKQPQFAFMIFNPGGSWAGHEFYLAEVSHLVDSQIDFTKYEVPGFEMMTTPDFTGKADIPSDHEKLDELVDTRTPEEREAEFKDHIKLHGLKVDLKGLVIPSSFEL